ncbi:MAG: KR domain-containing protein [Microcoleus sp. SM1_3_4]|nr:KR domain-containing protein [Microcoleus sp. SM1_3_4]
MMFCFRGNIHDRGNFSTIVIMKKLAILSIALLTLVATLEYPKLGLPQRAIGQTPTPQTPTPQPQTPQPQPTIRQQASYLITGGLSGLGLEVADWLVTQRRHPVYFS